VSTFVGAERLYEVLDARTLEILERRRRDGPIRRRGWLVRRALLLADLGGLSLAFFVAQLIYASQTNASGSLSDATEFATFVFALPLWIVAAKVYGLYDRDEERADHSTSDDFAGVFHLMTVGTFFLYAVSHLTLWFSPEFTKLFLFWLLGIGAIASLRAGARTFCRRQIHYLQNTLIVGAGDVGQQIARKLLAHHEYGINLVGFVDANPKERLEGLDHLTILGDTSNVAELVRLLDVERVIYAFSNESHEASLSVIRQLADLDTQVDIIPRFFDALDPRVQIHTLEGVTLLGLPPVRLNPSSLFLKRSMDIALASVALVLTLPVMLLIAAIIRLESDGPAIFRSARVGRRGSTFYAYKFRTMSVGASGSGAGLDLLLTDPVRRAEFERTHKFEDDPRVSRVGSWLRRRSLDELPQLWNILRGDISIVGPRPITTDELALMDRDAVTAAYWSISDLRPGLTGYWQINGRSAMDYADRVRLDRAYLGGWSIGLDLSIVAKTFRAVLTRRGAR
jgi:exopolysaccharide biosynthesis polyprenyl glycosylphosphotransferase